MNQDRDKLKLSAILSADAVGYSRLMEADRDWTIKNLKENKALISDLVEEYKGRVVDSPGNNLLDEFGSVINAVDCAVKVQEQFNNKNSKLMENNRMHFRIGVNLGDVVEEEDRIYGNGVNLAALAKEKMNFKQTLLKAWTEEAVANNKLDPSIRQGMSDNTAYPKN